MELKRLERGVVLKGKGEDASEAGGRSTKKSSRDWNQRVSEEGAKQGVDRMR